MADAFEDRLQQSFNILTRGENARYDAAGHAGFGNKISVPPERRFVGLDAYQKAIQSGVDVVLLAGPPGFRPMHFDCAVKAGKHVFMEKPLATDVPGVRKILEAAAEAKKKDLKIGVGLQRRYDPSYIDTVKRLRDGAIGKIVYLRCYWDTGFPAKIPLDHAGIAEMEYQVRSWYFFTWLSGDHIVEQHIHNLDVCNWLMNAHPVEAQGQGGRQVRTGKQYGQIFDHHFVEFTYADGTKMFSQCRQIPACFNAVSEHAHGAQGYADVGRGIIQAAGKKEWRARTAAKQRGKSSAETNPYQIEHNVLFDAVRNNRRHNDVELAAQSTMTAILGRMATYSGQVVKWDDAMRSGESLLPDRIAWDAQPKLLPDADGRYPSAIPGVTKPY